MKKFMYFSTFLSLACMVMSCEMFSRPIYSFSRDISGDISSLSTNDLAGNIDKLAADPDKTADVLNELAGRDQKEIKGLSQGEKEKLLEAGVGAIIPTSKLGETVDVLTKGEEKKDVNKIMETLTSGSPDINTKALETVLEDDDMLNNANVGTLALGAASLIVNTVKNEGGNDKMDTFQQAAQAATSGEAFNEETFKQELEKGGFSKESVSALTTAMGVTTVLSGTAGDGKPNRKADAEKIEFGGYSLKDLLDEMTGEKA